MKPDPCKTGLTPLPLLAASFVVLVCVAILGMSGWREWTSRELSLRDAEVDMANMARSLSQHAEDSLDLLDSSILGAVTRLENDGTGAETLSKLKSILVARRTALKRIYNIIICDESGHWLAAALGAGPSLEDRAFFLHHMQSPSRDAFIGKPVIGMVSSDWITTVSRRFNHPDGSFAGVVVATIDAKYFSEFYRQFDTGTNGAISLLSAAGVIMARSPDNSTYVGRDLSNVPLFKDPSLQSPQGVYYFKSPLDGVQRVSFFQRSDRFPVVVVATAELDEVLASWRHDAITRMLFVLSLVILITVMGHYLVRQLLRGQRMAAAMAAKEANFRVLAEATW